MYLTTDGTTPTNSSPAYAAPITIRSNTVIKVLGVEKGYNNSAVAVGSYSLAQAATPSISPPSDIFTPGVAIITNGTTVTLSCSTLGNTIYYTLDGSTPSPIQTRFSIPAPLRSTGRPS